MSYSPVRPGTSESYHGGDVPAGYLLSDGSEVSRTVYAALFAAIGTRHGSGNGVTTFNIPDSRGRLERYVDGGTGRDPDAAARAAMAPGGATGSNVGSTQGHQVISHAHSYLEGGGGGGGADGGSGFGTLFGGGVGATTGGVGGNETRPINFYATKMVKY